MKKIGILIEELTEFKIEVNAVIMNSFLLYDLIEKIEGYEPLMIILSQNNISTNNKKINYYNKNYNYINYNSKDIENNKFDILLQTSYEIDYNDVIVLKTLIPNIKIGLILLGNSYFITLSDYLYMGTKVYNIDDKFTKYDFIWTSPHYEHCITYIKTKYKTENVYISPYIWDSKFIERKIKESNYKFNIDNVDNIGIFEGNIMPTKTSIIPIYICERLENKSNIIKKVTLTNLCKFIDKQSFNEDISILDLYKKNKLLLYDSPVKIIKTLKENNINTIVSHQVYNELNYLHLEALYMKLPLIHNSKMLMNYGYYYPDFDIEIGSIQLEKIILEHKNNIVEYNKLCEECISKYSINNQNNIDEYKKLLNIIN